MRESRFVSNIRFEQPGDSQKMHRALYNGMDQGYSATTIGV